MLASKNGLHKDTPQDLLQFRAQTVTSSKSVDVQFDRKLPAGDVARSVASMLQLPVDTDWQLRADDSAAFLEEQKPIGEQLESGAQVSVTPRAHLGAPRWWA